MAEYSDFAIKLQKTFWKKSNTSVCYDGQYQHSS